MRNGTDSNVVDYIRYTNCEPCNINQYKITSSSRTIPLSTLEDIVVRSNSNGLNPYNPSYDEAYSKLLSKESLLPFKYVAFVENNDNIHPYFGTFSNHNVGFLYESIVSTSGEHIWGKYNFITFYNKPFIDLGVLDKVDGAVNTYVLNKHFLGYIKSVTTQTDCLLTSSELSYDGYQNWLINAVNQDVYKALSEVRLSKKGEENIAIISQDDVLTAEFVCDVAGGKLTSITETINSYCQVLDQDYVISGNQLYNITCASLKDNAFFAEE